MADKDYIINMLLFSEFLNFCKISINLRVYSGRSVRVWFSLTFSQK